MEFRCPDPSCTGYLAFSALLMAALDGIENKIDPGEPLDRDIYAMTEAELAEIPSTPGSLDEALIALERDHEFLLKGSVFSKGLIESWDPEGGEGSNLLWKSEKLAGRSSPIVLRGKLYTIVRHQPETEIEGEKVVCADAATGEILWEYRFNMYLTDVPDTRIGWSCAAGDPETGVQRYTNATTPRARFLYTPLSWCTATRTPVSSLTSRSTPSSRVSPSSRTPPGGCH